MVLQEQFEVPEQQEQCEQQEVQEQFELHEQQEQCEQQEQFELHDHYERLELLEQGGRAHGKQDPGYTLCK